MSDEQDFDEVGRGYWWLPTLDQDGHRDSATDAQSGQKIDKETRHPALKDEANLISSMTKYGTHKPVLDIDVPCRYVPSSTSGHGHLYVDVTTTWPAYVKLMEAMVECGILQDGYVQAAIRRKATFVRPEWVRKPGK